MDPSIPLEGYYPFNSLSNELVTMILEFAVESEELLSTEAILLHSQQREQVSTQSSTAADSMVPPEANADERAGESAGKSVEERFADALKMDMEWHRYTPPRTDASDNFDDWLNLNKTCRRFRMLVRQPFLRSRTLVVPCDLPDKIEVGEINGYRNVEDLADAFKYTRSVMIDYICPSAASKYLGLPKVLKMFKSLNECTIIVGQTNNYSKGNFSDEKIPERLKELIHELGVKKTITLKAVLPAVRQSIFMNLGYEDAHLEKQVYPVLQWKADLLKKHRST